VRNASFYEKSGAKETNFTVNSPLTPPPTAITPVNSQVSVNPKLELMTLMLFFRKISCGCAVIWHSEGVILPPKHKGQTIMKKKRQYATRKDTLDYRKERCASESDDMGNLWDADNSSMINLSFGSAETIGVIRS